MQLVAVSAGHFDELHPGVMACHWLLVINVAIID